MSLTKIILTGLAFLITWIFPSFIDGKKFVSLTRQVSIKTNKNFPPHIAFEAMINKTQAANTNNKNEKFTYLSTSNNSVTYDDPRPNVKKLVLNPIIITKTKEIVYQAKDDRDENTAKSFSKRQEIDNSWMQDLRPFIREKLSRNISNNRESHMLADENQPPQNSASLSTDGEWEEGSLAVGASFGFSGNRLPKSDNSEISVAKQKHPAVAQAPDDTSARQRVSHHGANGLDQKYLEKSSAGVGSKNNTTNTIVGLLEVNDGLAITNEHHIEIRRYEEGTFQERGTVNLIHGTYQIDLQSPRGYILARLVTAKGKVLGEGIGRVSDVQWKKTYPHNGPKINITKKIDIKGQVVSAYNQDKPQALSGKGKAGIFKGYASHELDKFGQVAFDNVVGGSSTTLVSQVNEHLTTQQIILANSEFKSLVYPRKMIEALKSIVSEQRQINFNDPNLSVIMGQVVFDNKAMSGIKIQIENYPELEPIYFNSLMLPDTKLKVTSENGYFAFIGAPDDIHHVVAHRGESYFGHLNVKVNAGVLSFAKIESSIKTEEVEVKVYDAFSGQARESELTLQSLSEKIEINEAGFQSVFLPSVQRWSLLHASPSSEYQSAYYSYIDKTDYINVPLISKKWLMELVAHLKINIYPTSGIVMGFVHDEDFTVEVPNYENLKQQIIYFDYAGRILKQRNGTQGGGFILFNLPTDNYEILVMGSKSQKIYSRIAPVKSQDLFVFNFKLDN